MTMIVQKLLTLIGPAKDFFNILFFVIAGIVTVLTYLTARKSLLQPIKTEIIKRQLDIYIELNAFIDAHGSYCCGQIALTNIVYYCSHIIPTLKNLLQAELLGMALSHEGSLPVPNSDIVDKSHRLPGGIAINPLVQTHTNGEFALTEIQLDKEYFDVMKSIEKYKNNPFLANELIECLTKIEKNIKEDLKYKMAPEIEKTINENIEAISKIVDAKILAITVATLAVNVHNNYNRNRNDYLADFMEMKTIIRRILQVKKYV